MGKIADKNKQYVPPRCGAFMGIKGVKLYAVTYEFTQDTDCCQEEDDGQHLKVSTPDGGGGCYVVIETNRWAVDHDDVDKFAAALKRIVSLPESDG